MTKNEQISNVMGWEYFPKSGPFPFHNGDQWFDLTPWEVVKEMQAKMVADGWSIDILNNQFGFEASALRGGEFISTEEITTEPAAIVELFCKVYGIK